MWKVGKEREKRLSSRCGLGIQPLFGGGGGEGERGLL